MTLAPMRLHAAVHNDAGRWHREPSHPRTSILTTSAMVGTSRIWVLVEGLFI